MVGDPSVWAHHFKVFGMDFCFSDQEGFADLAGQVYVIRESTLMNEGVLGSDVAWSSLDGVLRDLPHTLAKKHQDGGGSVRRP